MKKVNLKLAFQLCLMMIMSWGFSLSLSAQVKHNEKLDAAIERTYPKTELQNENARKRKSKSKSKNNLCKCENNIIQNGNFSQTSSSTSNSQNIYNSSLVPPWDRGTNTPRYAPGSGYASPGFIVMWGNKTVSESIKQKTSFKKGMKYKGCFAFKYTYSHARNPSKHIRFKLLASKTSNLNTPGCPSGNCKVITMSQTIEINDGWQVHTFNWIADDDYDYLYVTPENDETRNAAENISHGWFDDLCIQEIDQKYDLPICCPPMNEELLRDLFDFIPNGSGGNATYKIRFNNNSYFSELWQTYMDYISIIDPGMEDLAMHIRLIDAGTNNTPTDTYSPMVSPSSQTWIWFKQGQGGNIFGNKNVFADDLQANHWYKIHTGIYTVPVDVFKNSGCPNIPKFFFRVRAEKGKKILQISNGKKVIKEMSLGKMKTQRSRRK